MPVSFYVVPSIVASGRVNIVSNRLWITVCTGGERRTCKTDGARRSFQRNFPHWKPRVSWNRLGVNGKTTFFYHFKHDRYYRSGVVDRVIRAAGFAARRVRRIDRFCLCAHGRLTTERGSPSRLSLRTFSFDFQYYPPLKPANNLFRYLYRLVPRLIL